MTESALIIAAVVGFNAGLIVGGIWGVSTGLKRAAIEDWQRRKRLIRLCIKASVSAGQHIESHHDPSEFVELVEHPN